VSNGTMHLYEGSSEKVNRKIFENNNNVKTIKLSIYIKKAFIYLFKIDFSDIIICNAFSFASSTMNAKCKIYTIPILSK
jgi:hypothetical protein